MSKRRSMTAEEFLDSKANDTKFQEMLREQELERAKLQKMFEEDQRDLVTGCVTRGVIIRSVWDLVNTNQSYLAAIPVLADHLLKDHHPRTREGIVRALITPESRGLAARPLIKLFRETSDSEGELKNLIGAAIAESATGEDTDAIISLINDETHGRGRECLPLGLIHSGSEDVRQLLTLLKDHSVMGKSAKKAMKLMGKR